MSDDAVRDAARGTVVVTGAAGFIGRHVCAGLAAAGYAVRGVDLREQGPAGDGIAYSRLDVRDTAGLRAVVDGAEHVVHLASAHLEVNAPEALYRSINVDAAERLVALCHELGVRRLVHTSSVGIYGHVRHPPAREDSEANPQTIYERTKLEGERRALAKAREVGQDIIVLRPGWVYGPGCPRTLKLARSLRKRLFFYVGSGANLRHPIYVDDLVRAYLLALEAPGTLAGRVFVIAGDRPVTLKEYITTFTGVLEAPTPWLRIPRPAAWLLGAGAELAFGVLGGDPPFSRRSLGFFANDSAFDISAARADLGFHPTVGLEEGLTRTLRS